MRLKNEEVSVLKNKLKSLSAEAKLYLFGSRVDDTKRGEATSICWWSPSS